MPHTVSPQRLFVERSAILVIDLQEKLVPVIPSGGPVVDATERLLRAAEILDVPYAATVQYPKGLGGLVSKLADRFPAPEEKLDFSSAVCREHLDRWIDEDRDQILITGIETHVCVLQTVLDLIAENVTPFVVAEAVAARGGREHETAMTQMRDVGAVITSVESVMFQWLGTAAHQHFKAISAIVKETPRQDSETPRQDSETPRRRPPPRPPKKR